jgi:hypothetical protein
MSDSDEICTICQDVIGSEPTTTTLCEHVFHTECLNAWETSQHTNRCPSCNQALNPDLPISGVTGFEENYAPDSDDEYATDSDVEYASDSDAESDADIDEPAVEDGAEIPLENMWVLPAGEAPADGWSNAIVRGANGTAVYSVEVVLMQLTVTDATGAANQGDTRYDLYLGDGSLAAQNAWVSYHSPNDFCMFDCYRQDYLL